MFKKAFWSILICILLITPSFARDAAIDLQKIVGYTIVSADSVRNTYEIDDEKIIRLINGSEFKVNDLIINPLGMTDVIVFAKPISNNIISKYKGKLPERYHYLYKLLIDNEIYDAEPK